MTGLIYFFAVILPRLLFVGLALWLILTKDKWQVGRQIVLALIGTGLALGLAVLIKNNFPSPRPFEVLAEVKPLFPTAQGDAFPSGHATIFTALALGLYWRHRRAGLIFLAGAVLISLARIWAGVHWPVDILAGFVLGASTVLLFRLVGQRLIFHRFGL